MEFLEVITTSIYPICLHSHLLDQAYMSRMIVSMWPGTLGIEGPAREWRAEFESGVEFKSGIKFESRAEFKRVCE